MKKAFFLACSVFILVAAGVLPPLALSEDTCGISGFVTDQNEDAVEKATIKLMQGSKNLAAKTNQDGYYCFYSKALKNVTYSATVSKTGYKTKRSTIKYKGIELNQDFVLEQSGGTGGSTGGATGGSSGGSSGGSTGGSTSGGSSGGSGSPALSVTPKSRTVGYGATSTSFDVTNTGTGTLSWRAAVSSGGDWMEISYGSSGTNSGTITVVFSANTTSKSRGGIIRVEASSSASKYVTVTQEAGSSTGGTSGGSTGGSTGGTTGGSTGGTGGTTGGSTSGGTTGGSTGGTTGGTTGGSTGSTDTTAPTTTASPAGSSYTSAQSVTLTCSDSGSGCYKTFYTTDGNSPTTSSSVYSSAIAISATTTLKYFSVDNKGNQEAVKTQTYTISIPDTTAPSTTASPGTGSYTSAQSVTLTCSDTGGSGCSKTYYTTNGTTPTTSSSVYSSAISISATTTLKYFSVDGAGNQETVKTETYTISPKYTDNGNGTITANETGLMWQKQDDGITRTWNNAVAYCASLSLGGYSGWRLPSVTELSSIVESGVGMPTINTTYFPNTVSSVYWSSSTDTSDTSSAWVVAFNSGSTASQLKVNDRWVRCVR